MKCWLMGLLLLGALGAQAVSITTGDAAVEPSAPQYVGLYRGAEMAVGLYQFSDLTDPLGTSTRIGGWPFPAPTYETVGFDGESYFIFNRGGTFGGPGLNQYDGATSFSSISDSQTYSEWYGIGACNEVYYGLYSGTGMSGPGLYIFMDSTDPGNTCVRLFENQTFSSNVWTDVAFDGERYLFVRNDSDGGTPGIYQYDPDNNDFRLVSGSESYSDWQGLGVFDADLVPHRNKKAYVLLFGGQSNALGWGYQQYLLDTDHPLAMPQQDIDFLYRKPYGSAGMLPEDTLMPLQSGNSNSNVKKLPNRYPALTQAPVSRFGPELSFARRVRDLISVPDSRVGVMKFASGGSSLYDIKDWRPDGTADRSADGRLYQIFQHTAWRCIAAMKNKYPTYDVEVLGMGWVQGESDALETQGAEYEENLTRLVADVRTTFGTNLTFVLSKISLNQIEGTGNANKLVQWPIVMAAQDAVAAADPKVVATKTEGENYTVSTGLAEGQYHYSTPSLLQIGEDLAEALVLVSGVETKGAELELTGDFEVEPFVLGVTLFSNRDFTLAEAPEALVGQRFLRGSINGVKFKVVKDGILTVLTPESDRYASAQCAALEAAGFVRIEEPALFQLFGDIPDNQVRIYRKGVKTGERFEFKKWTVVLGFSAAEKWIPQPWAENQGDVLYNGIQLPTVWPPEQLDVDSTKPMAVPYLDHPPKVILIDVGRQLLVDDFLVEKTDLKRTFHYPKKYEGNPVLKAETEIEMNPGGLAGACPKSGGLWWDPDEQIFKLWYEARWVGTICYATSTNGLNWDRPETDVVPGFNQVLPLGLKPDSWTVVRDWWTDDPNAQYKIFVRSPGGKPAGAMCFESPDGLHWGDYTMSGVMGDRSTMFYNPFRKKWVYSLRSAYRGRSRHYWEGDVFMKDNQWDDFEYKGRNWKKGQPVVWAAADELDPPDPVIQDTAELYNLDAVAYESIMLGFYQIYRGPDNNICNALGRPKLTELNFAYSRDGFHWARPDRTTAIESSREAGTWDRGYVQSLGNICVLRGDEIWFYYTGYAGDESKGDNKGGMYANGAMGVATLRRDGFASMDADAKGTLTTRTVTFSGKHLFVNANVPNGSLRAEVLDADGDVIQPFTLRNSIAFEGDSTIQMMTWSGGGDLAALAGQTVKFRFTLEDGAIYSFWVSQDETGRSDGYVAGGGPGYTGPTDTVGAAVLNVN